MKIRLLRPIVLALVGGVLANCQGPFEPQIVTFEYRRAVLSDQEQTALSSDLLSGSVSFSTINVTNSPSCQFSTNVQTGILEFAVNGDPFTEDPAEEVNVVLRADNDLARPTNDCPNTISIVIRDLAIQTGQDIRVGSAVTNSGTAKVVINGEEYSSDNRYFRFELTSLQGDYGIGEFEFLARNTDDPTNNNVVLVYNGNFAVED